MRSKKDAEHELRTILTRIEGGILVKPTKLTVGEYLEQWLRDYVLTNTAPTTADGYSDIVRSHLIPELGRFPLNTLQPSHIQAYYARMLESGRRDGKGGLSAQTVKHHHRVLHEALNHGQIARKWSRLSLRMCVFSWMRHTTPPITFRFIRPFIPASDVVNYLDLGGGISTWTWRHSQ